jgi:hypothetical protein
MWDVGHHIDIMKFYVHFVFEFQSFVQGGKQMNCWIAQSQDGILLTFSEAIGEMIKKRLL